jgi:hypothetical protein
MPTSHATHPSVLLGPSVLLRYCADQLTWLITKSLGASPNMEAMARLQEDIDECDRRGNVNQDIDGDENLQDFASIVAAARSRADVDDVVLPLLV